MSFAKYWYERYSPIYSWSRGDFWNGVSRYFSQPFLQDTLGYTQYKNTQQSLSAQMDYEQYLRFGNERALADWHKNVPNRQIRYPELSYPGQIRRADTSLARANFDYDTAAANYSGNILYRSAGLYGIGSRVFRDL